MPDPTIKPAIDEIKAVLAKYDMAAIVFVSSPTHTEFLLKVNTAWSVMRSDGNVGIRFRAVAADFPSKADQKRAIEISTGVVMGFADACRNTAIVLDRLTASLGSHFDISHISRRDG